MQELDAFHKHYKWKSSLEIIAVDGQACASMKRTGKRNNHKNQGKGVCHLGMAGTDKQPRHAFQSTTSYDQIVIAQIFSATSTTHGSSSAISSMIMKNTIIS